MSFIRKASWSPAAPNNRLATKSGIERGRKAALDAEALAGRLHLAEQMQIVATHWKNVVSTPQMNLRRFVVMSLHMADCAQITTTDR